MKGLSPLPTFSDLEGAYDALVRDARPAAAAGSGAERTMVPPRREPAALDERALALYSQWARFDPRLAELCVEALTRRWRRLRPLELREAALAQPWPAALGVLLEFAARTVAPGEKGLFGRWRGTVTHGLAQAAWEQYFIGQRAVGGQAMQDDARFAASEYRRWGYLGRDPLFNKSKTPATLDPSTREQVLIALLERQPRLRVEDYWKALEGCVSRRQAERDLKSSRRVRAMGNTRGRQYVRR